MKRLIFTTILLTLSLSAFSQVRQFSVTVAERDTCQLVMNVFMPDDNSTSHPCIMYIFGGGFMLKSVNESTYEFCRNLARKGFVTVMPDYRLGMKKTKASGVLGMVEPLETSVHLAVEDCFDAVEYLLDNEDWLKIDSRNIVLLGSSAGAITALQMDYELCNRTSFAAGMPDDFHFAGIISCSGAVFSRKGLPAYQQKPAPTFFLHGMNDKLVIYDKIQVFNIGFFGSNQLQRVFRKNNWPHIIYRYEGRQHEVSIFYLREFDAIISFIDKYVIGKAQMSEDCTITDLYIDPSSVFSLDKNDLYNRVKF